MEEKIKRDKEAGLESHNYIQYLRHASLRNRAREGPCFKIHTIVINTIICMLREQLPRHADSPASSTRCSTRLSHASIGRRDTTESKISRR